MTLHVIGAGLAGLSTALRALDAGLDVIIHEATAQSGGRCRSWPDPTIGAVIDNGTHMVVGANRSVFRFLERTGGIQAMRACHSPLPMTDLDSGATWTADPLRLLPTVLASLPRMAFGGDADIASRLGRSRHFHGFWEPLAVSVMNTPAEAASARVFRRVLSRTLWRGGSACRPHLAVSGLSRAFARPAEEALRTGGVEILFHHPLRGLGRANGRATSLLFDDGACPLSSRDSVVVAVPWTMAARLIGELPAFPSSPIVNAHFRLAEPPVKSLPDGVQGVVGADAHWLFLREGVLSVTVSAASSLAERSVGEIAERLWSDCARALALAQPPKAARVIKEKRATLFHTPEVERKRPRTRIGDNLFLAGDWTATGLPCTIESAILSGERAAAAVLEALGKH